MPTYSRIRATDPAPAGAKFRATWAEGWRIWADPVSAVRAIQESGPARGFYVVSSPAVSPGDDSFVLDVRTQSSWRGTAADLARALDGFTLFDLERLELTPAGESADQAAAARDKAQAEAEREADRIPVLDAAADVAKDVATGVRSTVIAAAVVALAVVALMYAPQLKAVGRAVARKVGK